MNTPKLLPSLMCVDFSRMAQTLEVFEQCGIDALHVNIMDGEFVPNYALGTDFCRQLRKLTPIPLDIHLMISRPDTKLSCFAIQPGEYVSVHWESTPHIHRTIGAIAALGGKPMLAINPATPYDVIRYLLPDLAGVLVMTVGSRLCRSAARSGHAAEAARSARISGRKRLPGSGDRGRRKRQL